MENGILINTQIIIEAVLLPDKAVWKATCGFESELFKVPR